MPVIANDSLMVHGTPSNGGSDEESAVLAMRASAASASARAAS
jgi:hypothetical protein